MIEVLATEKKVSKWLHLAVQSGSNKILKEMNRNYKIENYIEKVMKLKSLVPNLNLTTDIIVGFPGETEDDFNDTIKLIKTVEFDDGFIYKYNIRENTLASKEFTDDVSEEIKLKRLSEVIDLQRGIQRKNKLKRIGTVLEVIPDKFSKKDNKKILANSQEDIMVLYDGEKSDFNNIINVKITKLEGSSLFGDKIS